MWKNILFVIVPLLLWPDIFSPILPVPRLPDKLAGPITHCSKSRGGDYPCVVLGLIRCCDVQLRLFPWHTAGLSTRAGAVVEVLRPREK